MPFSGSRLAWWMPIVVMAMLLAMHLDRWSLWGDEVFTWNVIHRSADVIVASAAGDRHPPLYYLLVAPFGVFPDRDWILRLPSALAALGALFLVRWGVPRVLDERVGVRASWILALSPILVLFGVTARMYAFLLLAGAGWLVSGLWLARGTRPGRAAVATGLATMGAIWTHYAGITVVLAGGLAIAADLATSALPLRERLRRMALLVGANAVAGLTFLPWALGPLQFQLANKDAPADRTWFAERFALWAFDDRIPWVSVLLAVAQVVGLVVAIRRRAWWLVVWAGVAVVLVWVLSSSGPAQNPRNHIGHLPFAAVLLATAVDWIRDARVVRAIGMGFVVLSLDPLYDLAQRPNSPQERNVGFDRHIEAHALDAAMPANAGLHFRPSYVVGQYRRYSAELGARNKLPLDGNAWLGISRAEWLEPSVTARFPPECTFGAGFRLAFYAQPGAGCEALSWWVAVVAEEVDYTPFQMELSHRALADGDLETAARWAERAVASVRGHPSPALTLARIRLREEAGEQALSAADAAWDIAREYGFPGNVMGEAQGLRASALQLLGREAEAASALALVACVRSRTIPSWCGTPWEPLSGEIPAEDRRLPERPLPALTESQKATPPDSPPEGARRVAVWTFDDGVLPEGWSDVSGTDESPSAVVVPVEGQDVLLVSNTAESPAAMACGPVVAGTGRIAVRARWRVTHGAGEGRVGTFLEMRMFASEERVLRVARQPVIERPLTTWKSAAWRVDRFDVRTPASAGATRLCLRVDGERAAQLVVDWVEVSVLEGG